ncbi:hypothetical protein M3Y99_01904800 [Aphelenchoides fujianensis]|nr:hypothetical protein M3Y99_01904800 [Aphelenchoides fujianensis]
MESLGSNGLGALSLFVECEEHDCGLHSTKMCGVRQSVRITPFRRPSLRTVAQQKRYVCLGNRCQMGKPKTGGGMCKFHRFQRCIQEGLNMNAVVLSPKGRPRRRAELFDRPLGPLATGNKKLSMGSGSPSFPVMSITVEFSVLNEYLRMVGFEDLGFTRKELSLKDYEMATKCTIGLCEENINAAKQLHSFRMDEVDFACLFQILALRIAAQEYPEKTEITHALNDLFARLQTFYDGTYENVALRMGNVIMATQTISHSASFLSEYTSVLHLVWLQLANEIRRGGEGA